MRLLSPRSLFIFSNYSKMTRGLPQGGALSPVLWILRIKCLFKFASRELEGVCAVGNKTRYCRLLYADDVAPVISPPNETVVKDLATREVQPPLARATLKPSLDWASLAQAP